MQATTLAEIKRELKTWEQEDILILCLKLGRFKKDNKELLSYLLFESQDEQAYITSIKEEISDVMDELKGKTPYQAMKGLRKLLRLATKRIRYSGNKQTETEVLLHFCSALKNSSMSRTRSTALSNLFDRQVQKINKAILSLHEDLQADYRYELDRLYNRAGD